MDADDDATIERTTAQIQSLQKRDAETRKTASELIRKNNPKADAKDTDYVFLTFVIENLPTGLVGVLMASIFCAAMSATASGLNSLASTSVVDIWKRLLWRNRPDHQYVLLSKADRKSVVQGKTEGLA